MENIWGADLRFSLYVIDIYGKYSRIIPLKGKKGITITNGFQSQSLLENQIKYG